MLVFGVYLHFDFSHTAICTADHP